jgi:flagellar M-ring protein FliF
LLGLVRPAMKGFAPAANSIASADELERGAQLDAVEADKPERPQLSAPSKSLEPLQPSTAELMLDDARKLTRDNPAAVANIIKAWMNGEAAA